MLLYHGPGDCPLKTFKDVIRSMQKTSSKTAQNIIDRLADKRLLAANKELVLIMPNGMRVSEILDQKMLRKH